MIGRIHNADPATFDPMTPAGPVAGEVVTLQTGGGSLPGMVVGGADKIVVPLSLDDRTLALANAAGGVLTRTVTVTVLDSQGDPVDQAVVQLALAATVALVSVAIGATGKLWARAIAGTDALATVETGPAGTAELVLVVGGAAAGEAIATSNGGVSSVSRTTWTF